MKNYGIFLYLCLTLVIFYILTGCSSAEMEYAMPAAKEARTSMMESEAPMEAMADEPVMAEEAQAGDQTIITHRKRIYNGSAGLIVDKLDETRKSLEEMAVDSGGYVESSYNDYVVLRIPAEQFHSRFEQILTLGKVEFQEISTWDVTDQYSDSTQRLNTALKTRERLYDLLERTNDAEERARILREIGRLSEEIESIKQQLILMENRIAFSRISVRLIPRLESGSPTEHIPFDWIARLDPLTPVSGTLKARVRLNPGDDYAVFIKERFYMAENAEGTSIFLSTLENNPEGDSSFWQNALLFHLKDYYEDSEAVTIPIGESSFEGVRFISKDREAFQYIAAVLADRRELHVLEIFSPRAHQDLSSLFEALKEGEIK